ncbi:MAG: CBS domain-containing protein [Magnetococcales bacterium]|nr:CBS domain-containing protein [Magnetococcales bacterium]
MTPNQSIGELDLVHLPILPATATIREAARHMQRHDQDAAFITKGTQHGVITSSDIRDALALDLKGVETPVAEITSWNLVVVSPDISLLKAFLLMDRRGLKRVAVGRSGNLLGSLEWHRLLSLLTHHPILAIEHVRDASSLDELARSFKHRECLVRTLLDRGVRIDHLGRLLQELDRKIFQKVAAFVAPPDIHSHLCILMLGSEGRGEQLVASDQDNALVADDSLTPREVERFATAFASALLDLGYPPCPGNVMMNHPAWNGSVASFLARIRSWIDDPTPENLLHLAVFFDARPIAGNFDLFWSLRRNYFGHLPQDQGFHARFAMPTLAFATPLGFFHRFIVEKGSQQGRIDLKKGGIFPIVHGVRSLALERRLKDPNTRRRIQGLVRLGVLEPSFAKDLLEAFAFFLHLRLRTRMENAGLPLSDARAPSDHVSLDTLGRIDREHLRHGLVRVDHFKELINHHFQLRMLQ